MYISGTLKNKGIAFYKPKITAFSDSEFMTNKIIFSYTGEILFLPWDKAYEQKLEKRQEVLINEKINTNKFVANKKFSLQKEVENIMKLIYSTNRKYTYALLECLAKMIYNANTKDELIFKLEEFITFINWLDKKEINQIDLDILISLFLNRQSYNSEDLKKAKEQKFHIVESEILSEKLEKVITFGEFVSPARVPKIALSINEDLEYSMLVLPIYFAIKDELDATKFLKLCRTSNLDVEQVKKNARLLRIPDNIQNLIR